MKHDANGKYIGPGNPTHGKASTYRGQQYKCRCTPCTEAHTTKHYEEHERRRLRLIEDPTLAPHGNPSTYTNWGCRCDPCTEANSAKCAVYNAKVRAEKRKEEEAA